MTDPRYIGTILYVGLAIFAALLAAGLLMQERRRSVQRTVLLWGAEGLILLLDLYLCFGLLPAALRLPVTAEPSLDDIFEADRLARAYTRERFSDR